MSLNRAKAVLCSALVLLVSALCCAEGDVDQARLNAANSEPQNWLTLGRDGNQSYFSPLAMMNDGNVGRLGFAWTYDLGTTRGQEATPIVIDGVMYTSGTWGFVYAVNAATGKELWKFDPHADPRAARNPCSDLVNRGVAAWKGKVCSDSLPLRCCCGCHRAVLSGASRRNFYSDRGRRNRLRNCCRLAQPALAPLGARPPSGDHPVLDDALRRVLGPRAVGWIRRIGDRGGRPVCELERAITDSSGYTAARNLLLGPGRLLTRRLGVPGDRPTDSNTARSG